MKTERLQTVKIETEEVLDEIKKGRFDVLYHILPAITTPIEDAMVENCPKNLTAYLPHITKILNALPEVSETLPNIQSRGLEKCRKDLRELAADIESLQITGSFKYNQSLQEKRSNFHRGVVDIYWECIEKRNCREILEMVLRKGVPLCKNDFEAANFQNYQQYIERLVEIGAIQVNIRQGINTFTHYILTEKGRAAIKQVLEK